MPYLPNFLWIVAIVICAKIALGSTSQILRIIYKHFNVPQGYYLKARIIVRLIVYVTSFFMILLFIPGIDEKALALVGLGIGVVISLSSTTAIGNVVAGFLIHYTRPMREGDRVEIDGVYGDVVSVELMFVHIKTIKDRIVSIPSLNVMNKGIKNYSALDKTLIHVSTTLGYDLDPGKVEQLLMIAIAKTDGILTEPKPFILIRALNDYTVDYETNGYTDSPSTMVLTKSNLMRNIIKEFTAAHVQIMSPAYLDIMHMPAGEKIIPNTFSTIHPIKEVGKDDAEQEIIAAKKKLTEKKRQKINLEEKK